MFFVSNKLKKKAPLSNISSVVDSRKSSNQMGLLDSKETNSFFKLINVIDSKMKKSESRLIKEVDEDEDEDEDDEEYIDAIEVEYVDDDEQK